MSPRPQLGTAMLPGEAQPNLSGDAPMRGQDMGMHTQALLVV